MSRKLILASAAATAVLGFASSAFAAPPPPPSGAPQSVAVTGEAEAMCTLPDTWTVASVNNASASEFSGHTWTIPESRITDTSGTSTTGGGTSIRIGGFGFCNASHIITVQSLKGGMVANGGVAPPSGFANRRAMNYQVHWQNQYANTLSGGPGTPLGPVADLSANTANAAASAIYTVSGSLPPPGARRFDIKMSVQSQPGMQMVAGNYSDTIVVSLTVQ